ncbi:MAG TPA: hypothetical protein VHH35_18545 [Pyrinomonadaceae bacterium]|nr:hypothetical protein [Pyrinomonadaceae bacterium]
MNKLIVFICIFLSVVTPSFAQDCACEDKPLPEVLSIVNGVKITAKDLDAQTTSRIAALKQQVVEARKLELDLQINTMLLEAEAKKRGVAKQKILEDEVLSKAKQPTDADARAFFKEQNANASDKSIEFEQVKQRIMQHLLEQRRHELAKQFADRLRSTSEVKVFVELPTPPVKPVDRQRLFAVVNSKQITSADIEDSLQPMIFSVQKEMYELRRRDLDRKINDVLLAQEAQKRRVTTRALLDAEVNAKAPSITDEQAQKFYDENKAKMNGGAFADLKQHIIAHLQSAELNKVRHAFAETLRKSAAIQDFLTPPQTAAK